MLKTLRSGIQICQKHENSIFMDDFLLRVLMSTNIIQRFVTVLNRKIPFSKPLAPDISYERHNTDNFLQCDPI